MPCPVCPPRAGVNTASGVRGLGVEEAAALESRIGVATRTRGAGGGTRDCSPASFFSLSGGGGVKSRFKIYSPGYTVRDRAVLNG